MAMKPLRPCRVMGLDGAKDAYEVSLVAVPAQPGAGIIKSKRYGGGDTPPAPAAVTLLPLPYGAEVPGWGLAVSESGTLGWVMTAFLAGPPKET